jgi:DNA replication and repair protein RecF
MRFLSVGFKNFRNLVETLVPIDSDNIVLIGENGQGKTNFLEALYMLCYGSSFRTANARDMVAHGCRESLLSAVVLTESGFKQQVACRFGDGQREILLDGRLIKDRKELIYNIPCIAFSHDDIEFVRGNPENRRRFFDQTMSLHDPLFFDDLRNYRMVLKQRNAAIKEQYLSLLPLYDERLAQFGFQIQQARKQAVEQFNEIFPSLYSAVSGTGDNLRIVYKPSWGECTSMGEIVDYLVRTRDRDMVMLTTAGGIHRDQFNVMQGKSLFANCGSTGQMRLASLLFRTAQMRLFKAKTGKEPILLMDDVLLELDIAKRGAFLEQIGTYSQAFFTFLPDEQYFSKDRDKRCLSFSVKCGEFSTYE